jgi:hypothetical protein
VENLADLEEQQELKAEDLNSSLEEVEIQVVILL